jgi:hypothetical protein
MQHASRLAALTVAAVALAGLAGNAMAQEDQLARDLTVEQTAIYTTSAPQTGAEDALGVTAWVDHEDNTYAVGEQVRLFVQASKDAYVTIINVGASGQTTVLFPNEFQTDNLVQANTVVEVPDSGSNATITVTEPVGTELIKVIASTEPISLFDATQLAEAGDFTTVRAKPSSVARDLQVTMATETEAEWDDYNKVILTVVESEAAATAAPSPGEVPSQPFALQVAADKQLYQVGEPVTLMVMAEQSCYLTLVNIGTSGQARMLFPNQHQQNNLLQAGQTVVIPGVGAPVSILISGPAGIENVIALCSTGSEPVFGSGYDFTEAIYPSVGDARTATRDLSVVANSPEAETAMATIGFVVAQ